MSSMNITELKTIGEELGFVFDAKWSNIAPIPTLLQFTFRHTEPWQPHHGATFYAKDTDSSEEIMRKAHAKIREFKEAQECPVFARKGV
jgi:hypothetical protein